MSEKEKKPEAREVAKKPKRITVKELSSRIDQLSKEISEKPSLPEIKALLNRFAGEILEAVDKRIKEAMKPVPKTPQPEETPEAPEVPEIPEDIEKSKAVLERIFGRQVSPDELGTFMHGLGVLISSIRGPPVESPFEEAGRAMFTVWTKEVTKRLARLVGREAKHEATH